MQHARTHRILIPAFCLGSATIAAAQSWTRSYSVPSDETVIQHIVVADSGERFALGSRQGESVVDFGPWIAPMDANGGVSDAYWFISVSEGGFHWTDAVPSGGDRLVVSGYLSSDLTGWMAEVDAASGAVLWSVTPGPVSTSLDAVTSAFGGYVAAGSRFVQNQSDLWVIATDPAGSLRWRKRLGHYSTSERGTDLVATSDGHVVVCGLSEGHPLLVKLDSNGVPVWSRRIENASDVNWTLITEAATGDLLVAAATESATRDSLVVYRLDSGGMLIWEYEYDSFSTIPVALTPTADGGALLALELYILDHYTPVVAHLAPDGMPEWVRALTDPGQTSAFPTSVGARPGGGAWATSFDQDAARLSYLDPDGLAEGCTAGFDVTAFTPIAGSSIVRPAQGLLVQSHVADEPQITALSFPIELQSAIECGSVWSRYCEAAPNSAGQGAHISASGSTRIEDDDFSLRMEGLPPSAPHLVFFGANQIQVPFGDGQRCSGGSVRRIYPVLVSDSGGSSELDIDFASGAADGFLVAGSHWNFQGWYRDPAAGQSGFNLTDAIHVSFH